jgi:DNA helicase HerA-like ATPase
VSDWLTPRAKRTPAVILTVAHLDDDERALVLGVLLEEVLSWVRGLSGSTRLRALIVFDEVYGFLPPHPANPPTKRPLVALMKQARAFGVGVVIATQNPMDLDYRALSNAGLWCVGRLQTDADRARVLDGLAASIDASREDAAELGRTVQRLGNRWFVVKNSHAQSGPVLLNPRYAMSWMRGPMTRVEIQRGREWRAGVEGAGARAEATKGSAEAFLRM